MQNDEICNKKFACIDVSEIIGLNYFKTCMKEEHIKKT